MANGINNKYEYRSGLLDSLNVQHTASDVRNEDEYRKKVLNGLGVEFTDDDINQKSRYRAKVVEGLASSGGGGSSDFSKAILVNTEELEPNVSYSADKTVAEISQAMNEGKMVFVDMGNKTCIVTNCNTVLKRIDTSVVTFNTTSMGTTCAVSANISATAQFSSTDDYPVFVQQSV